MGATTFFIVAEGTSATDAFTRAIEEAQYEYGHGGYTGTIAEKDSFVRIKVPPDFTAMQYAEYLINQEDPRIDDKWGPAGCIQCGHNEYLFFGWASE